MGRKLVILGQGYVGLPLAICAARAGFTVIGLDVNKELVSQLNFGNSTIKDVSSSDLVEMLSKGNYAASNDFSEIMLADIILICVPTPLGSDREPDLSSLIAATEEVGKNCKKGQLIIIESTVSPSTTEKIIIPILEEKSKLNRHDLFVAFSPERIDPGNKIWNLKNTPKLVAGLTEDASNMAVNFYSSFIEEVIKCKSIEIAETAKLLENSFRLVNISFINEFSKFCSMLGIDVNEVIIAASSKPYGFMPFYPSLGVGGHCIPVDPLYLANKAREIGAPIEFIGLADKINKDMPFYFVRRAEEKIGALVGKKILVLGISYKPNIADVRETPVESLIINLKGKGAKVSWHDDLVKTWNGENSVALSNEYDLAILATPHDYLDLSILGDVPILNTRSSI